VIGSLIFGYGWVDGHGNKCIIEVGLTNDGWYAKRTVSYTTASFSRSSFRALLEEIRDLFPEAYPAVMKMADRWSTDRTLPKPLVF
jgi:hypothetical protein